MHFNHAHMSPPSQAHFYQQHLHEQQQVFPNNSGQYVQQSQVQQQHHLPNAQMPGHAASYHTNHTESKNELRSPGQHGPVMSTIDKRVSVNQASEKNDQVCQALLFNSRVNANVEDNHADILFNTEVTNIHRDVCVSSHKENSLSDHSKEKYICKEYPQSNHDSRNVKKKKLRNSRLSLNFKRKNNITSDEELPDHNNETEMYFRTGKSSNFPSRNLRSKNVKSLHLKIPKPVWNVSISSSTTTITGSSLSTSLVTSTKSSLTNSCKEISDHSTTTYIKPSLRYRSLRPRRNEISYCNTKNKRASNHPSPVEIQIKSSSNKTFQRYRGRTPMKLKINSALTNRTDCVDSQQFEEIAKHNGIPQKPNYSDLSSSSDECTNEIEDQTVSSCKKDTLRRSLRLSSGGRPISMCKNGVHSPNKALEAKLTNEESSSCSQANNVNFAYLSPKSSVCASVTSKTQDGFFFKFKEYFIRRHRYKESLNNNHKPIAMFFPNVQEEDVEKLQNRLRMNMTKCEQNDISSSSDDEDDFLEDMILKGKISELESVSSIQNDASLRIEKGDFCFESVDAYDKIHTFGQYSAGADFHIPLKRNFAYEPYLDNKSQFSKDGLESIMTPDSKMNYFSVMNTTVVKEDYLKSQMGFFEDISSESDSNNTIIMDNSSVKGSGHLESSPPSSSYTINETVPISPATESEKETFVGTSATDPLGLENPLTSFQTGDVDKCVTSEKCSCLVVKDEEHMKSCQCIVNDIVNKKHTSVNSPLQESEKADCVHASTAELNHPNLNTDHISVVAGNQSPHNLPSQQCDKIENCEQSCQVSSRVASPQEVRQTIEAQDKAIYQTESTSQDCEHLDKVLTPEVLNTSTQHTNSTPIKNNFKEFEDSNMEYEVYLNEDFEDSQHLTSDCSEKNNQCSYNNIKIKINKAKSRKYLKESVLDSHSSSNEDSDAIRKVFTPNQGKQLRQRKQVKYTYCSDDVDSDIDELRLRMSTSSESDSNTRRKGRHRRKKASKNVSNKAEPKFSKNGNATSSFNLAKNSDVNSKPVRGRKKKGKLNCLSVLHMATLANLTESQVEGLTQPLDKSSVIGEMNLQYADAVNDDHNIELMPSLETMSFISPNNSEELDCSPPVASSPTSKHSASRDMRCSSRRLLNFNPGDRASIKSGINNVSNLSSKPLPLRQLTQQLQESASSSSSPVLSNFVFGHTNSANAAANDSDTPNNVNTENSNNADGTLQLLETKRAQVNCASFSMQDILRMTTTSLSHEDSMDSDSKDSAAIINPPPSRRAQVRSTSLSMSDVLKLTQSSIDDEEEENEHSSNIAGLAMNRKESSSENDAKPGVQASSSLLSQLIKHRFRDGSRNNVKQEDSKNDGAFPTISESHNHKLDKFGNIFEEKQKDSFPKKCHVQNSLDEATSSTESHFTNRKSTVIDETNVVNRSNLTNKNQKQKMVNEDYSYTEKERTLNLVNDIEKGIMKPSEQKLTPTKHTDKEFGGTGHREMTQCTSNIPSISISQISDPPHTTFLNEDKIAFCQISNKSIKTSFTADADLLPMETNQICKVSTYPLYAAVQKSKHLDGNGDMYINQSVAYPPSCSAQSISTSCTLNLSVNTSRSPNSYSPITPTSPISPCLSGHQNTAVTSLMSPPIKKAKSLWHPWLTTKTDVSSGVNERSIEDLQSNISSLKTANASIIPCVPVSQLVEKAHKSTSQSKVQQPSQFFIQNSNIDFLKMNSLGKCEQTQIHYPTKYAYEKTDMHKLDKCHNKEWQDVLSHRENVEENQCSSSSPNFDHRENVRLTDGIVTQLIKGDLKDSPAQPWDGKQVRKRYKSGNSNLDTTHQSTQNKLPVQTQSNKSQSSYRLRGTRDHDMKSNPVLGTEDQIVRPVKSAPSRKHVEKSLSTLKLNSMQPPTAYCSVEDDLPDKPM